MRVVVKFAGPLRSAAGVKKVEIELDGGANTAAVLRIIAERFPGVERELFGVEPKDYYSIFVNDLLVPEKDRLNTPLHEGDQVLILLPIAGGN